MRILTFTPTTAPISKPVTKFGGQPVWIAAPRWPLSRSTGKPMRFICQIALPPQLRHGQQQMAYVFMTEPDAGDQHVDRTWEPEGGENAVILQPADFDCIVDTKPLERGPVLQRGRIQAPGLFAKLRGFHGRRALEDVELSVGEVELGQSEDDSHLKSRVAGQPGWLQNEEWPEGGPWDLVVQIDSACQDFDVNFADGGVGYAFIRRDGRAARFLWQSL